MKATADEAFMTTEEVPEYLQVNLAKALGVPTA
jgi:hypothetical protein